SFDREPGSLLGVQQELSAAIAEQISLRLSPERVDSLARREPGRADAYDLYLRGRNFENQRTPAATRRAIEYYTRAAKLDPDYALAWVGIARTYAGSTLNGDGEPREVVPRARHAAEQALRADARLAESQFAAGYVQWCCDWRWNEAERALRRAVELDPRLQVAHIALGHLLSQSGRHAEALEVMAQARAIDPQFAFAHAISSQVAYQARDYQAALDHARAAIVLDPELWIGHIMQGQALEALGDLDGALASLMQAARFSDQNSKTLAMRAHVLAKARRYVEAREVLRMLEALAGTQTKYVPPYALALIHAGLDEADVAFTWLERAYAARDPHLIYLTVDPRWDPYRRDPRLASLLRRCGFPTVTAPGGATGR
ncbi:MAG TPA: tetratricopeptide repeat protein, partial [Vicinamibacterales bacterium]